MPTLPGFNLKHWSLAQQGIALVALLLFFELSFIGVLAYLANRAEDEAAKLAHSREIMAKAGRLMLVLYDSVDSVGRYARVMQDPADQSADLTAEVPALISWLRNALKDNSQAMETLDKIDKNITTCLPTFVDIKAHAAELKDPAAKPEWDRKRAVVQPNVNELLVQIPALERLCLEREKTGPQNEHYYRGLAQKALIVGLAVNIFTALLAAFLFVSRFTSRLDVLSGNIVRLKEGRMLSPLLEGEDELAAVDQVFHETAAALKREMKILKANEQMVRSLIEKLPVGLLILDGNGCVEFANANIEATFGYSAHQLLGKRPAKLLSDVEAILPRAEAAARENRGGKSFELTGLKRDGAAVPVDFRLVMVELDGQDRFVAMIADAGERAKLQQIRQSFVSMVRVELKQPLTRVADFLSVFGAGTFGPLSDKGLETTKLMQQNADRLVLLLNDLFDLEKLESGKIEIAPTPCNLGNIIERSVNAVIMFGQKYNVRIEAAPVNVPLMVDGNRIVQVLVNLLSNAVKFSPRGGVVRVAVRPAPGAVEIGVIDHGRGIPAEALDAVFEAYRQVEAGDAKSKGGTGLGLAICKAIVEAHQGQIGVQSKWGEGSVFWLRLPLPTGGGQR